MWTHNQHAFAVEACTVPYSVPKASSQSNSKPKNYYVVIRIIKKTKPVVRKRDRQPRTAQTPKNIILVRSSILQSCAAQFWAAEEHATEFFGPAVKESGVESLDGAGCPSPHSVNINKDFNVRFDIFVALSRSEIF